jgi:hypothetical protein
VSSSLSSSIDLVIRHCSPLFMLKIPWSTQQVGYNPGKASCQNCQYKTYITVLVAVTLIHSVLEDTLVPTINEIYRRIHSRKYIMSWFNTYRHDIHSQWDLRKKTWGVVRRQTGTINRKKYLHKGLSRVHSLGTDIIKGV